MIDPEIFSVRIQYADEYKMRNRILGLHWMSAVMMLVYAFFRMNASPEEHMYGLMLGVPALGIVGLLIARRKLILQAETNRILRILEMGIMIMAGLFFLQQNQPIPSLFYFLLFILLLVLLQPEFIFLRSAMIYFFNSCICIERLWKKTYIEKKEIRRITLKNNWLTIFCAHNVSYQHALHTDDARHFEPQILNYLG